MKTALKRLAARLPRRLQQELKRLHFARRLRARGFVAGEPEFDRLDRWVAPGDWALDVGANVGTYTARLSELVGDAGRVVAFEPVPETFELLAANVALLPRRNVTLVNAAASEATGLAGMEIGRFAESGLEDYYTAHLSGAGRGTLNVLCLAIDGLDLPGPVRLVKIDAEGHELAVLRGMQGLLARDRPLLIVEDNSPEVAGFLDGLGYSAEKLEGSSNRIFRDRRQASALAAPG